MSTHATFRDPHHGANTYQWKSYGSISFIKLPAGAVCQLRQKKSHDKTNQKIDSVGRF